MKPPLRALIFDVDGTLADTEDAHRQAFNQAFADADLDWHWDVPTYTRLLQVSGGRERIAHHWKAVRGAVRPLQAGALDDEVRRIHDLKNAHYARRVQDGSVVLRRGVAALIDEAHRAGLRLAIATTTSPVNIAALLRAALGPDWAARFQVIEDASTAPRKKPDPQVYLQTVRRLGIGAAPCLAFEDSANGLRAARGAGLATVVTPNAYTAGQDFGGALRVLPDLGGVDVAALRLWHADAACRFDPPPLTSPPCP